MAEVVERSVAALRAFRTIVNELKKSNKSWSRSSQQYAYLLDQMREHQLTQRLHCKAPNEVEHLANTYATYLTSTRRLADLQDKFKGGERSVEESAALMMDDEAGNRYMYLLAPVRDMEKNFNIDIAKELDEYNAKVTELLENGADENAPFENFNFAEAAVLIQGSTAVYGRKVDTVYQEARGFFHALSNKKKKVEEDDDEDEAEGADEEGNVTPFNQCTLVSYARVKPASVGSLLKKFTTRAKQVSSIKVMPMSLMPLSDFEKCNVPLTCKQGKRREAFGKKDDFKINTAVCHERGALLNNLATGVYIDQFASDEFKRKFHSNNITDITEKKKRHKEAEEAKKAETDKENCAVVAGVPTMDIDSGADAYGNNSFSPPRPSEGFEMNRERASSVLRTQTENLRPSTRLMEAVFTDDLTSRKTDHGFNPFLGMYPRHSSQLSDIENNNGAHFDDDVPAGLGDEGEERLVKEHPADVSFDDSFVGAENYNDLLFYDEFDKNEWKEKRISRCRRLQEPLTRLRLARTREDKTTKTKKEEMMETIDYLNQYIYRRRAKNKSDKANVAWADLVLEPYFAKYKKRMKERAPKSRSRKGTVEQPVVNEDEEFLEDLAVDEDVAVSAEAESAHGEQLFNDIPDDDFHGNTLMAPSFMDAKTAKKMRRSMANMMFNVETDEDASSQDDDVDVANMSPKEVVAYYSQKYWSSSEQAMLSVQSQLDEWETYIEPILAQQDTQRPFDVNEYCTEILDCFDEVGQTLYFWQKLEKSRGAQWYDQAPYLLSCLMMANQGNVKLSPHAEGRSDAMDVTLLHKERHYKKFEDENGMDYQEAPKKAKKKRKAAAMAEEPQ